MSNSKQTAVVRAVLTLAFSLPVAGATVAAVLGMTPASGGTVVAGPAGTPPRDGANQPPDPRDPHDLIWQDPPKPPTQ
jgi:hypothetical protein